VRALLVMILNVAALVLSCSAFVYGLPAMGKQVVQKLLLVFFVLIGISMGLFFSAEIMDNQAADFDKKASGVFDIMKGQRASYGHMHHPEVAPMGSDVYPICSMHWGKSHSHERGKGLTALDMSLFASHIYQQKGETIMNSLRSDLAGTPFEDIELEEIKDPAMVGRWAVFKMPSMKIRVMAIRGTQTKKDAIADASMLADVFMLQTFNNIFPIFSIIPKSRIRGFVGFFSVHRLLGVTPLWNNITESARIWQSKSKEDGYELVLTGHSLGGILAGIAAAKVGVQALTFSPPGEYYDMSRFGASEDQFERNVFTVNPHKDVVPQVDKQAGTVQRIECTASAFHCHSLERTAGALYYNCGDPRGRNMTSNLLTFGWVPNFNGRTPLGGGRREV